MVHGTPYAVISQTVTGPDASHWQYSSTEDDRNEAEWISEGVQVGSVGSGIGILGMWTSVRHLMDEPIGERPPRVISSLDLLICYAGAWWQWRVA
jgi:hypothetical protein